MTRTLFRALPEDSLDAFRCQHLHQTSLRNLLGRFTHDRGWSETPPKRAGGDAVLRRSLAGPLPPLLGRAAKACVSCLHVAFKEFAQFCIAEQDSFGSPPSGHFLLLVAPKYGFVAGIKKSAKQRHSTLALTARRLGGHVSFVSRRTPW